MYKKFKKVITIITLVSVMVFSFTGCTSLDTITQKINDLTNSLKQTVEKVTNTVDDAVKQINDLSDQLNEAIKSVNTTTQEPNDNGGATIPDPNNGGTTPTDPNNGGGTTNPTPTTVLAFPGAEGFGKNAIGGRGGKVIYVTNLNDSGSGSLRDACSQTGARTIVFAVGGTIELQSNIIIRNPNITIAGQTALGDGITLKNGGLVIGASEVIVRYLRIRPGDSTGCPPATDNHAINILGSSTISNIIIDHCSLSWGVDENLGTYGTTTAGIRNLTVQWSVMSEGLYNSIHEKGAHSCGMILGENVQNVTINHNLFAHNSARNPLIGGGSTSEVINNVIYDWLEYGTLFYSNGHGTLFTNIIGNRYIAGNSTTNETPIREANTTDVGSKIYVSGNDGFSKGGSSLGTDWNLVGALSTTHYKSDSSAFTPSGITASSASTAYTDVLAKAGAIAPKRDAIDLRIINDVKNKTGKLIDHPSDVGGWLTLTGGTAPTDTDRDGMPDSYETSKGLNPNSASDANVKSPSGYTWVEEYINSLVIK